MELLQNFIARLTSRKFIFTAIVVVSILFQEQLGINLTTEQLIALVAGVSGFNVMEGLSDLEKAKMEKFDNQVRETINTFEALNIDPVIYDPYTPEKEIPNPSAK